MALTSNLSDLRTPSKESPAALLERMPEVYQKSFAQSREAQQYLESRGLGDVEMWPAFRVGGRRLEALRAAGLEERSSR
jgi:hypothetical protein